MVLDFNNLTAEEQNKFDEIFIKISTILKSCFTK